MRPRGESSSSPRSTYVGQVDRQKPQCTQVRRIFSASAVCGSASWARVKRVCKVTRPDLLPDASMRDFEQGAPPIQIEPSVNVRGRRYTPAYIRPGLSTPLGSKLSLTRLVKA